ncbi:hypothetical protein, partial [Flavobacterium sp.]|uniref:hypothetical protein n=1 Tax=Flavobacterium sp. TaxID=239 RepID=UPI0037C09879
VAKHSLEFKHKVIKHYIDVVTGWPDCGVVLAGFDEEPPPPQPNRLVPSAHATNVGLVFSTITA